jgi:hypothetical protein
VTFGFGHQAATGFGQILDSRSISACFSTVAISSFTLGFH